MKKADKLIMNINEGFKEGKGISNFAFHDTMMEKYFFEFLILKNQEIRGL